MKKLILSFILLSGISFAQVDVATAKWKSNMVVDGSASDWKLPLSFYNSETKLFFGIGNDSANLYLSFQSNDEGNQVKINCAGMSISLFSKGKNKCDATINFPLTDKKSRF